MDAEDTVSISCAIVRDQTLIHFPPPVLRRLRREAKRRNVSMSFLVRVALSDLFKKFDEERD
jgi:hypothetical protein